MGSIRKFGNIVFSWPPVIIDAMRVFGLSGRKAKYDAIALIHADAVGEVSFQLLRTIGWRDSQVLDASAGIQQIQFSLYPAPELPW